MDTHLPTIGTRLILDCYVGTVRYVGLVGNSIGIWLGVEWDDPTRGKHDGSKDGKQYFICHFNTSGSFIRPTANIQYGVSFLDALTSKYIERLHGSETQEKVVLGSTGGIVQVEAVALDRVRKKFAKLDRLQEVGLDNAKVDHVDLPGSILQTCPNIRGLDLSQNLFRSWCTVAQITKELPLLCRLSLNRNRLSMPSSSDHLAGAFDNLLELHLNSTLLSWNELELVIPFMPRLQTIEMGYNFLTWLSTEERSERKVCTTLQSLNLDTNSFSDWTHLCSVLAEYKCLKRLILTANVIESISFPNEEQQRNLSLSSVEYLSLSDNQIASWSSLDALSVWLPNLRSLSIRGNPFLADDEKQARSFIVARIPSLVTLDSTTISRHERTDSELHYMSYIIQHHHLSDDSWRQRHPRWSELCEKHGRPVEDSRQGRFQSKLSSRLIGLTLYPYGGFLEDTKYTPDQSQKISLRILPNVALRILRIKICKTVKQDVPRTQLKCWLRLKDGSLSELVKEDDQKDLDWLAIEDGSQIIYQVIQ